MRIAFFDARDYDRRGFDEANRRHGHEIAYLATRLSPETAALARGFAAICAFVNDRLDEPALAALRDGGTRLVALRCAGYNSVDLAAAARLGIRVVRVPAYSPHAVAEHAAALMLSLARHIPRAHARVREMNFSLDGLVGFNLHGRTAGVAGTGQIGAAMCRILLGFGCRVIAFDRDRDPALLALGVEYVSRDDLFSRSDILSLHLPLNDSTRHFVDADAIARLRPGAMLVNTGRGGLIDSQALLEGLREGRVGSAGLDVYEGEAGIFFCDLSDRGIRDDLLARLLTFPNVLVTAHQAFLTREALDAIAETTLSNVDAFARGGAEPLTNEVKA